MEDDSVEQYWYILWLIKAIIALGFFGAVTLICTSIFGLIRSKRANCWLWRSVLVRRSQRARVRWDRLSPVFNRWIPQPRILHPYPDARFAATHPS